MLDASRGSMKDGNKNRLREQDLHRIVDTFNRQADTPRYARMVPFAEIADAKNDFNLNLPRYIDATEPEDLQDIAAHLQGGIPERDVAALNPYWQVLLGVRADLFAPLRPGYLRLTRPLTEVKPAIFAHPEFAAFTRTVTDRFAHWRTGVLPELTTFGQDSHPKPLIATLAESLLAAFQPVPLLDAYDLFQHLMDYWAATMQDDCYLISADGWLGSALPREIFRVKNKDNRLVWPEPHDYLVGKRRYKSDLVPAALLVDRFFAAEREAIERLDSELAGIEQQITARAIKARLKEIGRDPDYAEERAALRGYAKLLDQQAVCKARRKAAAEELDRMIHDLYPKLTEAEIKSLVVDDKWLAFLNAAVQGELDRVSQTLTGRIRVLAERYATSLPQLTAEIDTLAARVEGHLRKMGKDV
jgi:type I restriction enzyme M protein